MLRRSVHWLVPLALAVTYPGTVAQAQGGFLFQGVGDLEFFKTDSASSLLARGSGHPALAARGDVWAASSGEPRSPVPGQSPSFGTTLREADGGSLVDGTFIPREARDRGRMRSRVR